MFDVKEHFTDTDHFALVIASGNKITLLRFLDMRLGEGRTNYFSKCLNVPFIRNKEAQNISTFLDLPLSSKQGDLMALLKEKGFY